MSINLFPYEILSQILTEATKSDERNGVNYTFGLSQAPLPLQKSTLQRYVKGQMPPDLMKWEVTSVIREVCRLWHSWALEYAGRDVLVRRWKGGERWAELPSRRAQYDLYERVDRPSGTAVYKDPLSSLKKTVKIFSQYPDIASQAERLWFHGFYTTETDAQIYAALRNCTNLRSLSIPWTMLRRLDANQWASILSDHPIESLEFLSTDIPEAQKKDDDLVDCHPLRSHKLDFSKLRRLKIFGNTPFMPINDNDLYAIARTATKLEEFYLTCLSTITIDGVMQIVRASRKTLRVLEHSPRSNDGFWHPHPGSPADNDHLCEALTACQRLETVSLSLPSMCASLFENENVHWQGDFQVRALHLCSEDGKSVVKGRSKLRSALQSLLDSARNLASSRDRLHMRPLSIELFFSDFIFEPHLNKVHGDFSIAEVSSDGRWPRDKMSSSKGPYGSTGLYGKDDAESFECVWEDEFLRGVEQGWVALNA